MEPNRNRRAHARYRVSLSVEVFFGQEVVYGAAKNLSVGGLGLGTPTPLPEQAVVGVSLFLVEDGIEDERTEALNLRAQVVWCTPSDSGGYLAGLRFNTLDSAQRQAIDLFLRRLTS